MHLHLLLFLSLLFSIQLLGSHSSLSCPLFLLLLGHFRPDLFRFQPHAVVESHELLPLQSSRLLGVLIFPLPVLLHLSLYLQQQVLEGIAPSHPLNNDLSTVTPRLLISLSYAFLLFPRLALVKTVPWPGLLMALPLQIIPIHPSLLLESSPLFLRRPSILRLSFMGYLGTLLLRRYEFYLLSLPCVPLRFLVDLFLLIPTPQAVPFKLFVYSFLRVASAAYHPLLCYG